MEEDDTHIIIINNYIYNVVWSKLYWPRHPSNNNGCQHTNVLLNDQKLQLKQKLNEKYLIRIWQKMNDDVCSKFI